MLPRGNNRIPLTGLLHIFLFLPWLLATGNAAAQPPRGQTEEVPFVTSPEAVTEAMLDIARVGAADHVIDLGSGDGRIVIAAARRGATGLGVDNDATLVAESIANARRAGVESRARFLVQDLFATDLSAATVVTMYLLPEVNLLLRPALLALRPGTRVVSHDWDMGDWKPDRSLKLDVPDKPVGHEKASQVHLWIVPARFEGTWCAKGAQLRLRQAHQQVEGELSSDRGAPAILAGAAQGSSLELASPGPGAARLRVAIDGAGLRAVAASEGLARFSGRKWRRAAGERCPAR